MKLLNLNISCDLLVSVPDDNFSLRLAIDNGVVINSEFYELLFYKLLNIPHNYTSGGFFATCLDHKNKVLFQTEPTGIEVVYTETGMEITSTPTMLLPHKSTTDYITQSEITYRLVDEDGNTEESILMVSRVPQKSKLAENTGGLVRKGIALPRYIGDLSVFHKLKVFFR